MGLDAIFIGDLFCDLIFVGAGFPDPGTENYARELVMSPGGVANRAVAAARLGARTALVAVAGDDHFGDWTRRWLADVGNLDLSMVRTQGSTAVTIAADGHRDRGFLSVAATEPVGHPPAPQARIGHVQVDHEVPPAVHQWRANGTRVVGGVGWDPSGRWSHEVLDRLAMLDVFCLNAAEACAYSRADDPATAAHRLAALVPTVIVTLGADGVIAIEDGVEVKLPGLDVPVVDTTGAGDTFIGAYIAAEVAGLPLRERLLLARAGSAHVVGGVGGARSAPVPGQLVELLSGTGDALTPELRSWLAQPLGAL